MRLEGSVVNALVMTKKEQESAKEPGNFFYRIGIVKDEELGELSCTKEVFYEVEKMCSYDFGFRFNSEYKSLQLDRVLRGYGTLEQQAANEAIAKSIAAVSESAEAEEKNEESSATTSKSSKK